MYKIATPISHLFKSEEDAKQILAHSDCLECRDHSPIDKNEALHELFHFDMQIIHPIEEAGFKYIENILLSNPYLRLVSFHVASCCDRPILVDGVFQLGGNEYSYAELQQIAAGNIARMRTFIPESISICIENNNYLFSPAYRDVIEASFINELVIKNDIYFLYDIAHAHISTINMGIPFEDYYNNLPLSKIRQVHICKYGVRSDSEAFDAHYAPDELIYDELRKILHTVDVQYVTVEYYKETPGLINSLQYLQKLKHELPR